MLSFTILGISVVMFLGLIFLGEALRWHIYHIDVRNAYLERFYEAAERLIANRNTPRPIIEGVNRLFEVKYSVGISWFVVIHALLGRLFNPTRFSGSACRFRRAVEGLAQHQMRDTATALVCGGMSMTYNSLFMGTVVRRLMLFSLSRAGQDKSHLFPPGYDDLAPPPRVIDAAYLKKRLNKAARPPADRGASDPDPSDWQVGQPEAWYEPHKPLHNEPYKPLPMYGKTRIVADGSAALIMAPIVGAILRDD